MWQLNKESNASNSLIITDVVSYRINIENE